MRPPETEIEPEAMVVGWEPVQPESFVTYFGDAPTYGPNHEAYPEFEELRPVLDATARLC